MAISHWSMNDYHFPCQPTLHARATYKPRSDNDHDVTRSCAVYKLFC